MYTTIQINNLLDLNVARLSAGLIEAEEFDRCKVEILKLPRESVARYEKHDEANCDFCIKGSAERRAKMDNSVLMTGGQKSETKNGMHI
jgi:hypothetical protein